MFDAMQDYIQVVEAGSFSQAGKVLNKNASSVARQIDKLEDELGAKLFKRSTRRLELTLTGESFYQQSLEIISALDQARQSVRQDAAEVKGAVAISAFDSFGRLKIAPLLPGYCEQYPHVDVALSLNNSVVDLYQSHFDIAIRYGKPADSSLIMRPLVRDRTRLVASPEYLNGNPGIQHPDDLKHHRCLTLHKQRQLTYWYFDQGREQLKIKVRGALSSCGGEPLIDWCRASLGLTLLSEWCIEKELAEGSLVEVLPQWNASLSEVDSSSVNMLWTAAKAQNPAVRSLIDYIYAAFERS